MKILLIANKSPWPPKDGGSSATLSMISGLKAENASVTVLAFNTLKHHTQQSTIPAWLSDHLHLVDIDTGIKPLKLLKNLLFSERPYSVERFESEKFSQKLRSLLKNGYDIIQVEGLAMAGYLNLIRNQAKCRIVFRPHNVENIIWKSLAAEETNPAKRKYFSLLARRLENEEKSVINTFDGIVAITKNDLEWFRSSGLKIPSVVVPPAPLPFITKEKNITEIPLSVFYIGALDWRPNISGLRWFITMVWPVILAALPGATLHIAGRNPSEKTKRQLSSNGISFYGEVESSADFIAGKSLMVVPLFSASGIRTKIIEAMNMGKCIVATSAAAGGLEYEAGKDVFIADNADDFAGAVIRLLNDKNLLDSAAGNAMQNVRKNYDILVSAENLLKFYSQLF